MGVPRNFEMIAAVLLFVFVDLFSVTIAIKSTPLYAFDTIASSYKSLNSVQFESVKVIVFLANLLLCCFLSTK